MNKLQESSLKGIMADVMDITSRDSYWKMCIELAQIHLRL